MISRSLVGLISVASFSGMAASAATVRTESVSLPVMTKDTVAPLFAKGTTVAQAVSWVERAISQRLVALSALEVSVSAAQTVPVTDRTSLTTNLVAATSGLSSLAKHALGDSRLTAVSSDAAAMVLRYHVYKVLTPEINDVVASGGQFVALSTLTAKQAGVEAAVAASHQGIILKRAENRLDGDLNAKIADADTTLTSVVSALLNLNPANLDAARPVLSTFNLTSGLVQQDLSAASADIAKIVGKLAV